MQPDLLSVHYARKEKAGSLIKVCRPSICEGGKKIENVALHRTRERSLKAVMRII